MLAEADGGSCQNLEGNSIWSILQRGKAFNPSKKAIIAPSQAVDHLSRLVQPSSSLTDRSGLGSKLWRLAVQWASKTYWTGKLISCFLPAPQKIDCLNWSFAELERAAIRFTSILAKHNIEPGATILLIIPASAEWALMLWVCAFNCYTFVTADTSILEVGHEEQLVEYVAQLSPSVVIVTDAQEALIVHTHLSMKNAFLGITLQDPTTKEEAILGWTSMAELIESGSCDDSAAAPAPDNPHRVAMVIYTSGTSNSKPKGCLRRVDELLASFTITSGLPPVTPPVVLVNTKSYQAIAPCLLYATWYSGNGAVLAGGLFNPQTTLAAAAACRPLSMTLMAQMSDMIRNHATFTEEKVKSLKLIQLIGSTITMESLRRAQLTFPKAKVTAGFGMTEAACMIGWRGGPPKLKAMPSYQGIAASGSVLRGARIKIVNAKGDIVGRNEPGTLHLSGVMVTKGYVCGLDTGSFYEADGYQWLATTDCALMDENGLVFILGRRDGMISRSGSIVAPGTIENLLESEFSTATVVVVTYTPSYGEPGFFAVFDELSVDAESVKQMVVNSLGPKSYIDGAVDLKGLGLTDWPRNIAGKISVKTLEVEVGLYLRKTHSTQTP